MNNPKYLKDKAHYEDRYDRMVVYHCRMTEKIALEQDSKTDLTDAIKKQALTIALYFETGELYAEREESIREWMAKDEWRDKKYTETPVPNGVCRLCNERMELGYKDLRSSDDLKDEYMIFAFCCKKCRLTAWITEHGDRKDHIPWQCPKCKRELKEESHRTKGVITTESSCAFCGYQKIEKLDLRVRTHKAKSLEDEDQYRKDKARFCLSYEDGSKYIAQKANLHALSEMMKEKPKKPAVKNMNLPEVENILQTAFAEQGFEQLSFGKPDLNLGITVSFTVQDIRNREAYTSRRDLKRLIKQTLKQSNWRLISDDVEYQLGVLGGRLKGEERPDGCYVQRKGKIEFVKF